MPIPVSGPARLGAALCVAACLAAPSPLQAARGRRASSKKPVATVPAPIPIISTTSQNPQYRAAEARLARFITAIQQENRQRAVRFLSSRVTARERRALLEKRWLRKTTLTRGDFTQVLFIPDVQIRTRSVSGSTARLYVVPRTAETRRKYGIYGFLEVPMRRENGEWWVELRQ